MTNLAHATQAKFASTIIFSKWRMFKVHDIFFLNEATSYFSGNLNLMPNVAKAPLTVYISKIT